MISPWLICFSLVVSAAASEITGSVAIESKTGRAHPADRSGVVISLQPLRAAPLPVRLATTHFRILQKNKTFSPHILAIPVGGVVDFPNLDPIFHNAFSNYNGQIFDIGLYPPGTSRSVAFHRAGVVRVFCNIHSAMSAVIVVLASPYFTISNPDGSFAIEDVPPGDYRLELYYERATEQTLANLSRDLQVRDRVTSLGTITLSETGYLPMPHTNKYGRPYEPAPDAGSYPGARP